MIPKKSQKTLVREKVQTIFDNLAADDHFLRDCIQKTGILAAH